MKVVRDRDDRKYTVYDDNVINMTEGSRASRVVLLNKNGINYALSKEQFDELFAEVKCECGHHDFVVEDWDKCGMDGEDYVCLSCLNKL